ncbi:MULTISPECIES: thioredoxin family protein [Hydrogenophaga]|uniref:Thiol reductase thioredoxin n=1 Tax=Hydrogenophaga electricum TaxID=1230953 RepID=A0ABQ6CCS6_9BURK|nr:MULTISPECIES: thioredoxin family protein [Hydrogenophaga]GLS16017.1 thiol reductase thioredoxin [Hydrogenophaga electricum]
MSAPLRLICLCAEWCGTCRDWRPVFDDLARRHPDVALHWVDIEDDAELLDDSPLDVQTFPTVLIAAGDMVLFCGPVKPFATEVERLLRAVSQPTGQSSYPPLSSLLPHWRA